MDERRSGSHIPVMSERRGNIFRFRRLKWGDPKRLDGIKAIGLEDDPAPEPRRRGIGQGTIGLLVVGFAAAFAIGMSVFSGF
jgi:hypothetical protein